MKTTTTPSGTGRARLGLIVSMTVFGTIGLFVRRIEITSAELALCRAGLAAVFLLLSFLDFRLRFMKISWNESDDYSVKRPSPRMPACKWWQDLLTRPT